MMDAMMPIGIVILVFVILGYLGWLGERRSSNAGRVAFNPDAIDGAAFKDERIQEALDRGNKIEAIKLHHEITGVGLKEAKDAVEEWCGVIKVIIFGGQKWQRPYLTSARSYPTRTCAAGGL